MRTRKLRTRVLSMLLAFAMVLGMLPATAFAASNVPAPNFYKDSGNVTPGSRVKLKAGSSSTTVYYVINPEKIPVDGAEIKENPNKMTITGRQVFIDIDKDMEIFAVAESKNEPGNYSEIVSREYKLVPVVQYGQEMGGNQEDLAGNAMNVSKHLIKVGKYSEDAQGYYYLATKEAVQNVTAETIANDGLSITADTYAEISDKNGAIRLGNDGGTIYTYVTVKKADGTFTSISSNEYVVDPVTLEDVNITISESDVITAGSNVKLQFTFLSSEYSKFNPVYRYTVNGETVTVDPEKGNTADVKLDKAGDYTIKFEVSSDLGNAYNQTREVVVKVVEDAKDMTLTYIADGVEKTKTFPAEVMEGISAYITENNIAEATLKINTDITSKEYIGTLTVPANSKLTIDLNGHTVTKNPDIKAINVLDNGSLVIKDSTEAKKGKLDVTGTASDEEGVTPGIILAAGKTNFTLESGTIAGNQIGVVYGEFYEEDAYTGTVNVTGGNFQLSGISCAINMTASCMETKPSVNISGGTFCGGTAVNAAGQGLTLNVNGNARLENENGTPLSVNGYVYVNIGGNAVVSASNGSNTIINAYGMIKVSENAMIKYGGSNCAIRTSGGQITFEGNSKVESAGTSVINGDEDASVTFNGGSYKIGEKTMLIDDCGMSTIAYKADDTYTGEEADLKFYILNAEADKDGYYSLIKRQDLKLKNSLGQEVGYQNLEKLEYAIKAAQEMLDNEGTGDGAYTEDSKNAILQSKAMGEKYKENSSSCQHDIEILTVRINDAVANVVTAGSADPTKLADGTYDVNVSTFANGTNNASMASSAVETKAKLVVKDGKPELHLNFKPTVVLGMYGHLVNLWVYEGNSFEENNANADSLKNMSLCQTVRYYTIPAEEPGGMKIEDQIGPNAEWDKEREKVNGVDQTPVHFPKEVVMPLNYVDSENGVTRYVAHVSVDMMNEMGIGEQNVDFVVRWGTLKVDHIEPTLKVDTSFVTLLNNDSQRVMAEVLGVDGYTLSWESGNENVATVDNEGNITAVSEGITDVTVKATKADAETLVKTIKVTVAAAGASEISIASNKVGNKAIAEISGDTLVTNSTNNKVVNNDQKIILDTTVAGDDIKASEIVILKDTADSLAGTDKELEFVTNIGTIKLDASLVDTIAENNKNITLVISKLDEQPDQLSGIYNGFYELKLESDGKAIPFNGGKATIVIPTIEGTAYAYHVVDGKIKDKKMVAVTGTTMTWTTDHFSTWALSTKDYAVDDSKEPENPEIPETGFFLKDGNYYVDMYLWHATEDRASMGDDAFKNDRKALVTVKDGKITKVEIATAPVIKDVFYSAIVDMKVEGIDVTVLEKAELITKPANNKYEYIKRASFDMPEAAQPELPSETTYAKIVFTVPDTPMDMIPEIKENGLDARLKFVWSTATETKDEEIKPAADPVKAFVARLYTEVLGREADEKGLNDWTEVLKAQKESGAKVAMGFVDSDEFKAKDMTDEAFLQIMYRTFLGRDADEAGLKDWGAELEKGMSRMFVFRGFVESDEFTKICEEYNIIRGNVELNAPMDQVANQDTTKFVARCYKVFLGRKADADGINGWVSQLASGKNNAKQAAYGFVMSEEFQGKDLSNEDYVKTIYIGLLDREADPVGLAEWVKVLEDGGSRLDIFYGFADSPEFRDLARSYNLNGDWKAN